MPPHAASACTTASLAPGRAASDGVSSNVTVVVVQWTSAPLGACFNTYADAFPATPRVNTHAAAATATFEARWETSDDRRSSVEYT